MIEKVFTSLEEMRAFHGEDGVLSVLNLISGDEFPEMSLALIGLNGINRRVRNLESNATYSLLVGNVCFILWDGDEHTIVELKAGESVRIPAGRWYQDVGRGVMVSKNHKAFDHAKVEFWE